MTLCLMQGCGEDADRWLCLDCEERWVDSPEFVRFRAYIDDGTARSDSAFADHVRRIEAEARNGGEA